MEETPFEPEEASGGIETCRSFLRLFLSSRTATSSNLSFYLTMRGIRGFFKWSREQKRVLSQVGDLVPKQPMTLSFRLRTVISKIRLERLQRI